MDVAPIIADWKRRLVAMVETPAYVFRDTPWPWADAYERRLKTFTGFPEAEVAAAEARLGVRFPTVFREYLVQMGQSPGDLFRGTDLARVEEFEGFRASAEALLRETDPSFFLPPEAVVFMSHQGYIFVYVLAIGGFDGPPMQWTEGEREPSPVAPTFAEMVDAELRLKEENHRHARERGGYWLTIFPDGGTAESHPARDERPLDQVGRGKL
jgi:SMI1 / KNR4 family (SUKH-1)